MPLFGKSQKSPSEIVKQLKDAVSALERGDKKLEKVQEDISKNLVSVIQVIDLELNRSIYKKIKISKNFPYVNETLNSSTTHQSGAFQNHWFITKLESLWFAG